MITQLAMPRERFAEYTDSYPTNEYAQPPEAIISAVIDMWYWYAEGCYCGAGYALVHDEDGWSIHDLGHCSCYGPWDTWTPDAHEKSCEELWTSCSEELQKQTEDLFRAAEAHQ